MKAEGVKQAKAEGISGEDLGDKIVDMQIELKHVENEIQNVSRSLEQHRKKVGVLYWLPWRTCLRASGACTFDEERKMIFRLGRERERDALPSHLSHLALSVPSCLVRLHF